MVDINWTIIFYTISAIAVVGAIILFITHSKLVERLKHAQSLLQMREDELAQNKLDTSKLHDKITHLREALAIAQTKLSTEETRKNELKIISKNIIQAGDQAVANTIGKLSDKLLQDHKHESKQANDKYEKNFIENTKQIHEQYKEVTELVQAMKGEFVRDRETINTIERALSQPASAGQMSEALLKQSLESLGMVDQRDFVLQPHLSDGASNLRPDCLIAMPGNAVLIIDCKASKFLIDLENTHPDQSNPDIIKQHQQESHRKFAESMDRHLKNLSEKNYKNAVYELYQSLPIATTQSKPARMVSIMWLAYDTGLDKLRQAHPTFHARAANQNIFITGPTGLWAVLGVAASAIFQQHKDENSMKIVEECTNLIGAIALSVDHASKVSRGLNQALKGFDMFSRSVNTYLLPRANRMLKMGVQKPNKLLPSKLSGIASNMAIIDQDELSPENVIPSPVTDNDHKQKLLEQ